jgi:protein-S-isoprenylcysteine O-methyltransferase Ste14
MKDSNNLLSLRAVIQLLVVVVLIPFLPLLISRHWGWWEAWVYAAIAILGFLVSRLLIASRHPDLIQERSRFMQHENTASWDNLLAPLLSFGGILVMLVTGFDALFGWSPGFGLKWEILSLLLILAGYGLSSYALVENRFFSGTVRIQRERGHNVISSGPYRWVRHPGYAGGLATYLATPFFLDSLWAILPALFLVTILFIRTNLEDRFLQEELDGYREYAKRVRYRLIPGIW